MGEVDNFVKIIKNHEKRISDLEKLLLSNPKKLKKKSSKTSINDLLLEAKDNGFFNTPWTVSNIVEKFKELGYVFSGDSLTSPLSRAIKSRTLGRLKVKGKWGYVKRWVMKKKFWKIFLLMNLK